LNTLLLLAAVVVERVLRTVTMVVVAGLGATNLQVRQ
jgi:hypothetical protein